MIFHDVPPDLSQACRITLPQPRGDAINPTSDKSRKGCHTPPTSRFFLFLPPAPTYTNQPGRQSQRENKRDTRSSRSVCGVAMEPGPDAPGGGGTTSAPASEAGPSSSSSPAAAASSSRQAEPKQEGDQSQQPVAQQPAPAAQPAQPQPLAEQPPPPPPAGLSRYESQKRRDWNTFLQYLRNHKPPLTLARCSGAHVIEFLRYLDQFGKTKVHAEGCAYFGQPNPPAPCACPLRQAWGSLDALIGRLRAAYEESGGRPETNPFAARAVRIYLREVREAQAKARGIPYEKKKRKRGSASAAAAAVVAPPPVVTAEGTSGAGGGEEEEEEDESSPPARPRRRPRPRLLLRYQCGGGEDDDDKKGGRRIPVEFTHGGPHAVTAPATGRRPSGQLRWILCSS
ncbi:hypothetical protein HU200_024862 [Digitaria exilis]|uniref:ALOG domain-containing protein n=1 Tax=Digitaria exilis TaxID=1010633 RepID=A0A835C265_9POAL|nr:hypothetical protein HU200_024862 [Digitaria exilis]